MAKQKRLNTGLVAVLTILAMVMTVAAVGLVTYTQTARSAEQSAELAERVYQAGDKQRAAREYYRAYDVSRDPNYLIAVTRIQFEVGEWREALQLLFREHNANPQNPDVLVEILDNLWLVRDYLGQTMGGEMAENAERLLELEPENELALVSKAVALANTSEDPNEIDAAFAEATAAAPHEPRVVIARLERMLSPLSIAARSDMPADDMPVEEYQRVLAEAREEAIALVRAALETNPQEPRLTIQLAALLVGDPRSRDMESALAVVNEALEANPDSPELHQTAGELLYNSARTVEGEAREATLRDAEQHLRRAVEIEPALYSVYPLIARLQAPAPADPNAPTTFSRLEPVLEEFRDAVTATATLASTRAALSGFRRIEMIFEAFTAAIQAYSSATTDEERDQALAFADTFYNAAAVSFGNDARTLLMEGRLAAAREDLTAANQAFTQLATRVDAIESRAALPLRRDAHQHLMFLNIEREQFGEANKHADAVLAAYAEMNQPVPLRIETAKIELLVRLGENAEAYERSLELEERYPDQSEQVASIMAWTAAAVGRGDEAAQRLQGAERTTATELMRSRLAASEGDWNTAEQLLRSVDTQTPGRRDVVQLLAQVMTTAGKQSELLSYLQERADAVSDPEDRRIYETYAIVAGESDAEARAARLLALVEQIEDPLARALERFRFHESRNELEQAQAAADELVELAESQGDERDVRVAYESQYRIALRAGDWDRAGRVVTNLARINADRAGGARYRGGLALARGDIETALRELRDADSKLPRDARLKLLMAQTQLRLPTPRVDEAMALLNEAIEINPNLAEAHRLLFAAKERSGGFASEEEYRAVLTRAYQLNPSDELLIERMNALSEQDEPQEAIAKREDFRGRNPNDLQNLARLAQLYLAPQVGNADKAIEVLGAGVTAAQSDAVDMDQRVAFYRTAAELYAALRQREAGEAMLAQYRSQADAERLPRTELLAAAFYQRLGDAEAALSAFEAARSAADAAPSESAVALQLEVDLQLLDFMRRTQRLEDVLAVADRILARVGDEQRALERNVRLQRFEALLALGRLEEARTVVERFRGDYPDDLSGRVSRAKLLVRENELEGALAELNEILAQQPDFPWGLFRRGAILLDLMRFPEAENDLQAAKRVAPDGFNQEHRILLARLYEMTGRDSLAEAELQAAVDAAAQRNSLNPRAVTGLLQLYGRTEQTDKALELVSRFTARFPNTPFWHHERGKLLLRADRPGAAVENLRRAAELTEFGNDIYMLDYLQALTDAGRPSEAIDVYNGLPEANRAPAVRLGYTAALAALDRNEDARAELGTLLRQAAQNNVTLTVGMIDAASDIYPRAELAELAAELAEAETETQPRSRLLAARATMLTRTQQHAQARAAIDAAIAAASDGPELSQLLLVKADVLSTAAPGSEELLTVYEEILRRDPGNPQALNNLAFELAKRGSTQEALQYAQRLRELRLNIPAIWDTIGLVLMQADRIAEARSALRQALALDPDMPDANLHMGQLMAQSGEQVRARSYLERARTLAEQVGDAEMAQRVEESLRQLES